MIQKASATSGEQQLSSDHSLCQQISWMDSLVVAFKVSKTAMQTGAGDRVIHGQTQICIL